MHVPAKWTSRFRKQGPRSELEASDRQRLLQLICLGQLLDVQLWPQSRSLRHRRHHDLRRCRNLHDRPLPAIQDILRLASHLTLCVASALCFHLPKKDVRWEPCSPRTKLQHLQPSLLLLVMPALLAYHLAVGLDLKGAVSAHAASRFCLVLGVAAFLR